MVCACVAAVFVSVRFSWFLCLMIRKMLRIRYEYIGMLVKIGNTDQIFFVFWIKRNDNVPIFGGKSAF